MNSDPAPGRRPQESEILSAMWNGKPIISLSREDLLQVVKQLACHNDGLRAERNALHDTLQRVKAAVGVEGVFRNNIVIG